MSKQRKKITVNGLEIATLEKDYISLTDIAKQSDVRAADLIRAWLKNASTLEFLSVWEQLKNPNFKVAQMGHFKNKAMQNGYVVTAKRYIEAVEPIGLISKAGRYGGTFAHRDIALNFCYWLSPTFQVYMLLEFQRLKEMEFEQKNLKWHVKMITDRIDDVRNLLDTIPGQEPERNRIEGKIEGNGNES